MTRFTGKNVLITGASAGIGQATAARIIDEGGNVFGLGRSSEGLAATADMVSAKDRFQFAECDLASDDSIRSGVAAAREGLGGRIDALLNIAGVTPLTPITDFDMEVARLALQVNFLGPMLVISEALPAITTGQASVIVNVASTSATQATPLLSAYSGSKAALVGASMSLAVELADRRIRVVPISPSGVKTKMMWEIWDHVKDYSGDWYGRLIHLWGQEESADAAEFASFLAFAASEEATYWNASELRVDGGARASL